MSQTEAEVLGIFEIRKYFQVAETVSGEVAEHGETTEVVEAGHQGPWMPHYGLEILSLRTVSVQWTILIRFAS